MWFEYTLDARESVIENNENIKPKPKLNNVSHTDVGLKRVENNNNYTLCVQNISNMWA